LIQSGRRAGLLIEKSVLFYVQVDTTARSEYISPNKMIRESILEFPVLRVKAIPHHLKWTIA
jgi:hypothetical protein